MAQSGFKYRTLVTPKIFADMRGKGLSDRAKVLALYILLGNDVGNRIGLFPINFPGIAHANDWPQKTSAERTALKKDFLDVCRCFAWQYDEVAEVLFIRSHFKYCPMHHGLQLTGCLKDLSCLPETYLVHAWAKNAKTLIKKETSPKKTKENPNPKPTNLHRIFDEIVGPILAKIPKPDGATAPVPEAPAAKPTPKPEPKDYKFDEFWEVWPKHVARPAAERAWAKLKPDSALRDKIVDDVRTRARSTNWTKEDGQFIPHPATYINGRRWEDEATTNGQPPTNSVFEEGLKL